MTFAELEAGAEAIVERLFTNWVRGDVSGLAMVAAYRHSEALERDRVQHQAQWAGRE